MSPSKISFEVTYLPSNEYPDIGVELTLTTISFSLKKEVNLVSKIPSSVAILSTSQGIMTDKEARRLEVGGEVLCYVY